MNNHYRSDPEKIMEEIIDRIIEVESKKRWFDQGFWPEIKQIFKRIGELFKQFLP